MKEIRRGDVLMKMRVCNLKGLTVDNICLYVNKGGGTFQNLYKGRLEDVPEDLWNREIGLIGGGKKGLLDISLLVN